MTHRNDLRGHALVTELGTHIRGAGRRLRAMTRHHGGTDRGASAVEYGLLVAAIAAVVVVVVFALGKVVGNQFNDTCNKIQNGGTSTAGQVCTPK